MKKILFTIFITLIITSCVKDFDIDLNTKYNEACNLLTSQEYYVNTRNNCVSVVTIDDMKIAEVISPMNVMIPKGVIPQITYIPLEDYPNETIIENKTQLYQTICFEDSKIGDYDYNDLVVQVKYQTKGNIFAVGVNPIALGSTKKIKLGCVIYHRNNIIFDGIITENSARYDLFKNEDGFINTYNDNNKLKQISDRFDIIKEFKIQGIGADIPNVEWYIIVDNNVKLYAISTKYSDLSFDKNGLPYGIIITYTGIRYDKEDYNSNGQSFDYPEETRHIKEVYPYIWDWLINNAPFDFVKMYTTNNSKYKVSAVENGLYDITDYNILSKH